MKNNLLIALTALTLTACTSNLHALTKTRALSQTIITAAQSVVNYARKNKFKTASMVIGGAITLDALQAIIRSKYNQYKNADDIKKIKQELTDAKRLKDMVVEHIEKQRAQDIALDDERIRENLRRLGTLEYHHHKKTIEYAQVSPSAYEMSLLIKPLTRLSLSPGAKGFVAGIVTIPLATIASLAAYNKFTS